MATEGVGDGSQGKDFHEMGGSEGSGNTIFLEFVSYMKIRDLEFQVFNILASHGYILSSFFFFSEILDLKFRRWFYYNKICRVFKCRYDMTLFSFLICCCMSCASLFFYFGRRFRI